MSVSPWPGKCFSVVSIPPSCEPRMYAVTIEPTSAGSSPKERVLMIGFSGLICTSAMG